MEKKSNLLTKTYNLIKFEFEVMKILLMQIVRREPQEGSKFFLNLFPLGFISKFFFVSWLFEVLIRRKSSH